MYIINLLDCTQGCVYNIILKEYCTQIYDCPLWSTVFKYSYNNYVLHIMMHSDVCLKNQDGVVHQNFLYYTMIRRLMQ